MMQAGREIGDMSWSGALVSWIELQCVFVRT